MSEIGSDDINIGFKRDKISSLVSNIVQERISAMILSNSQISKEGDIKALELTKQDNVINYKKMSKKIINDPAFKNNSHENIKNALECIVDNGFLFDVNNIKYFESLSHFDQMEFIEVFMKELQNFLKKEITKNLDYIEIVKKRAVKVCSSKVRV